MLTKRSADKLASEYYKLGMALALGHTKNANILTKGVAKAKNLAQRHIGSRKPIGDIRPEVFKEFRAGFPKQPKGMSGGEYLNSQVRPYVQKQPMDVRMGIDSYIASRPGSITPAPRLTGVEGYQMSPEYANYWANSLNPNSVIQTRRADAVARYFGR